MLVGILLILLGAVWASQGAGMLGTGSLMDNNSTYVYLGGALAIVGVLLLAFGVIPRQGSQMVPSK
jgi:hypothetical protein